MNEMLWDITKLVAGVVFAILGWLGIRIVTKVDEDVKDLKVRVGDLEANIGPRAEALARVEQKLDDHVRREETITWKQMQEAQRQNSEAHAALLDGLREVSERVVAVETILNNRLPKSSVKRK
jgi:hypothetical protein